MYKVQWEPRVRETFIVVRETGKEWINIRISLHPSLPKWCGNACHLEKVGHYEFLSTLLFLSGGGRLAVHIESVEGDFFGLPTGRFG